MCTYFTNPKEYGFSTSASGLKNKAALQKALDRGGTIVVSEPGTYLLGGTVYIGSNTSLVFGNGVFIKKVDEAGGFSHILLNKGALTKTYDEHITVENLQIIVNGIDQRTFRDVFGLHGQIAFFYVKDLKISGFRCMDLGKMQYAIHVCTFEDVIVENAIIHGDKDGVHFGRGKRFTIRNCIFDTYDDAIALNAHDYDVGNPELGWIEDGVVENCHDLAGRGSVGYICRILAGAWVDWYEGMEVQKSDTVVSNSRLYRVKADPDAKVFISKTRPNHEKGYAELDGITWAMVQEDVTYTAGVRNVVFRDIFQWKPRTAFSIHFDNDRILHKERMAFLNIATPVDAVTITNSSFQENICALIELG